MMRVRILRVILAALATAGDCGLAQVAATSRGGVRIYVHENGALVRESFQVALTAPEQVVLFPGIPTGAEVGSVQLLDRRREVTLKEWYRQWRGDNDVRSAAAGDGRITVLLPLDHAAEAGDLAAVLATRAFGVKQFDLLYQVTGLTWRATYDVLVRGDLSRLSEPISVDVQGWFVISNETSRTFTNASLVVTGPDTLGKTPEVNAPGMLWLDDDSPMSDLWRDQPDPPLVPHRYEVGAGLDLPAGRGTLFSCMAATRQPVDQQLIMRSTDIPTDVRGLGRTPSLLVSFNNKREFSRGRALPPGKAMIYVGSQSFALYQKAWFKHAPPEAEIRIDLGRIEGVYVRRIDRGRVIRPDGGYEQVYELRINNELSHPVRILVDDAPLPALSWNVLRASQAYELINRQLVFSTTVKSRTEGAIDYTLRVFTPEEP